MKKILSILMLVVLSFSLMACKVSNVEYTYELNEAGDGYVVVAFDASKVITKNVILEVPSEYNGLPVKQVGRTDGETVALLTANRGYGKIIIPDSVEIIGTSAFSSNQIGEVDFGNGLKYIERSAFAMSATLEKAIFPDSLIKIGRTAFKDCKALYVVDIPNGCQEIGQLAFENCTSLTEIFIPASVNTIGSNAFRGCENITIKCEATSKPDDWKSNWFGDVPQENIIWGANA